MSIPAVVITKSDGNTGVVRPSATGVACIIAPSESGPIDQPTPCTRADLAKTTFAMGPLLESAAYVMNVAKKPLVLVRGTGTTVGAYGSVSHSGAGTSVATADSTVPLDDFDIVIKFVTAGTIGVAGITYQTSIDGGNTYGPILALGTAETITVVDGRGQATGAGLDFAAGTILANQTESFSTTGPKLTNADVVSALEALRLSNLEWECIFIYGAADATIFSTVDAWISAREGDGKYKVGLLNTRAKTSGESEATFLTAMGTAFDSSSSSSKAVAVGADYCDIVSSIRGVKMRRPVALAALGRAMAVDMSMDLAYVATGPVAGVYIAAEDGDPKWHDEAIYPGLDAKRFITLRSIPGKQGTYITNPNLLTSLGSDFVFLQHARCMARACEISFDLLTNQLSLGVQTKRIDDDTSYILESDAQQIEGLVQSELDGQLVNPKRVSGAALILSRTDNLASNAGATVTSEVQLSALRYVKRFEVAAKFVKSIAVAV